MACLDLKFFMLIIGVLGKCNAMNEYVFLKKYDDGKIVEFEERRAKLKCALSCSSQLNCNGYILSGNMECKLKMLNSKDEILLKSDLAEYSRNSTNSNSSGNKKITYGTNKTDVTTETIKTTSSSAEISTEVETTISTENDNEVSTSDEDTTFGIEDTTISAQFQQTQAIAKKGTSTLAPIITETPEPPLSFTLPPFGVVTTFIPAFVGNIETEHVSSSSGTTTATHDPNLRCLSTNMTTGDTSFEIKFPFNRKASLHDAVVYVYDCPKGTLLVSKKCARMIYTKQTSMTTAEYECTYSRGIMLTSMSTESMLKIKAWMVKKAVSKLWVSRCKFLTDVESEEFQSSSCTLGVDEPILCFSNAIPYCSTYYTSTNRCFLLVQLKKNQEDAEKRCKELSATFPHLATVEDNKFAASVWKSGGRAMFGVNDFSGSWKNYDGTDRSPSDYNYFRSWPSTSGDQFIVLVATRSSYYWSAQSGTENFYCQYYQGYNIDFLVTKGGSTTSLKSATFSAMNDDSNEKYRLYAYSGSRSEVEEVKIRITWDAGSTYTQPESEMEVCYTLQAILEP